MKNKRKAYEKKLAENLEEAEILRLKQSTLRARMRKLEIQKPI